MQKVLPFPFLLLFLSSVAFADQYQATITKITDGDTICVETSGQRVKLRLLGIDTPEKYPGKKMDKDIRRCNTTYKQMHRLGLMATRHAETMLRKGEKVTVQTFDKGYYGRTLSFVILADGSNYNEKEVGDGYACVYKYRGHKSRELSVSEFKKLNGLMTQARNQRKGLWGIEPQVMERLWQIEGFLTNWGEFGINLI